MIFDLSGGMSLFQTETSEFSDKIMPKVSEITRFIIYVYIGLLILCTITLDMAGMSFFDAVNHSLTTVSTGGFSTHDKSAGFFNSPLIEFVMIVFMILGALPLTYYAPLFMRVDLSDFRKTQVSFFLKTLVFFVLLITFWLSFTGKFHLLASFRLAAFNVVSIITSSGFATTDYCSWGFFAYPAFLIFALIGGCTGSTSGSIKIFRWQIMFAQMKKTFITAINPSRVYNIKIGNKTCSNDIASSVMTFLTAYGLCWAVLTMLVSISGVDIVSAASTVAACMTNSGPGLGDIVGPAGNYATLPDFAKWVLSFAMILGRLEIITMLVVFMPSFWRK